MAETIAPIVQLVASTIAGPIANEGQILLTVEEKVGWLHRELRRMHSFLADAERSATDDPQSSRWISEIRDLVYDSEDIIDAFDAIGTYPVACFFCHLRSRHQIGSRILELKSRLDEFFRSKSDYGIPTDGGPNSDDRWIHGLLASSPLIHQGDFVGFESHFNEVIDWAMSDRQELSVLSLVAMGGSGKTTLVKRVFNHNVVKRRFDRLAWIYVSKSFRMRNLFKEVAKGLMTMPSEEVNALNEKQLQELLLETLKEKRFLLVLDDVWDASVWEAIRLVLPRNENGSRVIITTRNSAVASSITEVKSCCHELQPLSFEQSWELFCRKVFPESEPCPDELKEDAEGIVKNCHGLPLAIVTIGGMMSRKGRSQLEWNNVLAKMYSNLIGNEVEVQGPLFLSYKHLPYPLKSCFLLFSIFPHDSNIRSKKLIRLLMAEGLVKEGEGEGERMEDVAEKYLMELINRSMIQISILGSTGRVKTFRIHHLIHQLSISIAKMQSFSIVHEDRRAKHPNNAYRISLQKSSYDALNNTGEKKLRSLFVFGIDEPLRINHRIVDKLRFLRVLDLEDVCLFKLPNEVGNLIHLRYLSLKGTRLKMLPLSLNNLLNLQTLDIRRTRLRKLLFEINNLKNLRNLEMKQGEKSIIIPSQFSQLENLQVITGVQADQAVVRGVGKLTHLRKLAIEDIQIENVSELCSSINNLPGLLSLSMYSIDVSTTLELEKLNPLSLQKLHIAGRLERLPSWFSGIRNLTKLRLGLTNLSADPFEALQQLPNLVFLQLYQAYQGKVMRCSHHGFRKLKILILTDLEKLEEWKVEDGTLQCIQEIWIMSCLELRSVPPGLKYLVTLLQLRLVSMPQNFISRLNPLGGADFPAIKHIPSIQVT
ncbi:disease resistance protein RPM1-like isoform X1 [Zingiber officinale]|uniref:disease resistance protein RPM1-like isoform X1 n=1 Tax=Zingiber officinale TaxID=94328 RepID=UPI001C4AEECC|nr:disease resistance protein RPM1-like isoform X1 [Zingiber officinale]